MKKLSFFLMAMLMSVMSFAETELFTQTYPGSPSTYTNAYTKSFTVTTGDYTLTYTNINNGQASNAWTAIRSGSKNGASVATIASEQIAAPIAKVVINFTQANASSTNALYLEVSANSDFSSATKIAADIAVGNVEFPIAAPAANQYYKITIDQAKGSANGFNRFDKVVFYQGEAAGEDVEIVAAPEFSVTEANFTTAFTLDITSEEGTTLKYTIDNTDPSTSATAIEVATNSTSVQITKSTAVKAIAIKGELKSVTKSKVYCYVNSAETAYTVAEAMEVIDAGLGLANELYVKGEISEIEKFDANYGSITYWIKDEEDNKFECYSGLGLNKAKFTSIDDLVVGSKVVVCGVMKKYNTIYEFNYNNYIVSLELPVAKFTVTATAENGTVEGAGEYEEGAEATLTATPAEGYQFVNWTKGEEVVSTENPYTFVVTADVALVANFKEAEPEIEWIEMPLEISNLTTMEMPVEGVTYLQLTGRNDQEDADVMLFLNDYTGEEKAYEVNVESSYMTFGGSELTVIDGSITMSVDPELGDTVYAGIVHASVGEDGETMYVAFDLKMYALPSIAIELEDVEIVVNEESAIAFFNATWEGSPLQVEVSGFEEVEFKEYPECWLSIGDDVNWVDAAAGPAAIIIEDGVAMLEGEFTSFSTGKTYEVMLTGTLPVKEEPALKGVVKRAVQLGESVVVLTHEADGTARIYNVVGENISEVSLEGVVPVDPEDEFDYLAISDIAVTEDGKLVATNYTRCNFGSTTYGTSYFYLWNDLDADPTIWFQSNASSNSTYSDQGYTMAVKGTSTNAVVMTTGVHNTKRGVRMSQYTVIDGVYEDINNAGGFKTSDYYFLFGLTDNVVFNENNSGTNLELNALGENWVMDGNLIEPTEWAVPATMSENHIVKGVIAEGTLGKKYNGATYVTVGNQVLMVAPYADAEGELAGVKILDVTAGFAAATEVAVADLDAAVEATAAATAVAVAENTLTITLVGDATLYTLTAELTQDPGPGTALENIAVEGKAVKVIVNGQLIIIKNGVQYNAQGAVVK